jgi:hypothetical protein
VPVGVLSGLGDEDAAGGHLRVGVDDTRDDRCGIVTRGGAQSPPTISAISARTGRSWKVLPGGAARSQPMAVIVRTWAAAVPWGWWRAARDRSSAPASWPSGRRARPQTTLP